MRDADSVSIGVGLEGSRDGFGKADSQRNAVADGVAVLVSGLSRCVLLALVCAVGLAVGVAQAAASVPPRIVGGQPAAVGTWPSVAYVLLTTPTGTDLCSGSVVAPNLVLTAGHCAVDQDTMTVWPGSDYEVLTGSVDPLVNAGQISAVSQVVVDPSYKKITSSVGVVSDWDAALLQLATPTTATPLPLATPISDAGLYDGGTAAAVAGWGSTVGGANVDPNNLQWTTTVVQSQTYCLEMAGQAGAPFDLVDQMCAIDAPTDSAGMCEGDSGGPLVALDPSGKLVEIGLTSFAKADCDTSFPDYFTSIDAISSWLTPEIVRLSPPSVTTSGSSDVTESSVLMNGTVNPNDNSTAYYFQWGTTTAYGNNSGTGSTNNGFGVLPVSATIAGLSPSTTYHYRLVGSNVNGTTYGADQTFTTTLPRMQPAKARSYARQTLAGAFGRRFKRGHQYTASCHRLGPIRFRCNVAWSYGANYYYGRVTVDYVSGLRGTVEWSDAYTMSWVNDRCYFYSGHPQRCAAHSARGSW
jgi:trypsin